MEHSTTIERPLVKLSDHHTRAALTGETRGHQMEQDLAPDRNVTYSVTWTQTFASDGGEAKLAKAPRACPCSTFA